MCDMGPDVRSGELSEGFVTSLRARTSRGRAEHAVRVPSVSRSNLEHWGPSFDPSFWTGAWLQMHKIVRSSFVDVFP